MSPAYLGRRLTADPKRPDVPAEQPSSVPFGLLVHLGPAVAFVAFLSTYGMTTPNVVGSFLLLAGLNWFVVRTVETHRPSVELPEATAAEHAAGVTLAAGIGVGAGTLVVLAVWAPLSWLLPDLALGQSWVAILTAVMLTDLVYYATHRWLGHGRGKAPLVRWFRKNHRVHHTVEHLDFLRGNVSSFVDTAITGFQLPLAIIAATMGLDLAATLTAYAIVLMLQATHHVNHTFDVGALRFFFMDNHAHKLHHCPRGMLVNHGALFSLWDLAGGTYYEDHSLSTNHMHVARARLPITWNKAA